MTSTQQFIEDAIAGGFREIYGMAFDSYRLVPGRNLVDLFESHEGGTTSRTHSFEEIILDPLAWQAVGKTRGWGATVKPKTMTYNKWHHFIDHLADGKSIDEALAAIA